MRGRSMGKTRLKAGAALAVMALAACAQEDLGPVRYAGEQCRRLVLIDENTGAHLRGVEDIELDRQMKRLYLSAYDRRAVEKAVRKRAPELPQGGVYAVSLDALFDQAAESVTVAPLVSPGDIAGGLRPHGLSFDAANHELVFINRAYQRMNGKWTMTPRLQRIGANGEVFVGGTEDALCTANDVLVTEQQVFTSFDHSACGWRAGLEDVFNLKRSGVASNHRGPVYNEAAFANGLTRTISGKIVLAATREKALLFMNERSNGVEAAARVELPGGPDNLSISYDGGVVAAAHPNLMRLGLNRRMGIGKAPSRIVKVDPETGGVDILFDDPKGALFSAATVGIETQRGLVAGSVTDKGVLVCGAAP